jgi:transcriptional regulator with XRE-family HTH domain
MKIAELLRVTAPGVHPVRVVRVMKGLSQRELEDAAGLPRTAISHIERGRRVADPSTRARIALALGCAAEDLFPDRPRGSFPSARAA